MFSSALSSWFLNCSYLRIKCIDALFATWKDFLAVNCDDLTEIFLEWRVCSSFVK